MTILGLPGIDVIEHCTCMPESGFVLSEVCGVVWQKKGYIGGLIRVRPAEGFEFVYNEADEAYNVTPKLPKPITYTIQFTATTTAAVKEVQSLLDAVSKHTTTFSDFRKEVSQ